MNTTPAAESLRSLPPILDCWYLTGPTASGKTKVSLELAQLLDAEIVCLDSMTVYRGMDIGTAKPTPDERQAVPHHLIDCVEPNEEFSLSRYVEQAHAVAADIRGRGRQVLFAGGTPLYLKSLLRGVHQGPAADWVFRREVTEEAERLGLEVLHQRLQQVDPLSAAKLHPRDTRRIVRALEVYKVTGKPLSHFQTQFEEGRPADRCKVFVLDWPRTRLHERINQRVERMFEEGLVDEVRALLDRYPRLGRTAAQAVGYREVIEHLRGERPLSETKELVKTQTRRFARRQLTWFRSLSECRWIEMSEDKSPHEAAGRIAQAT